MAEPTWEFTSTLWRHPGNAGWYFVTLPAGTADDIDGTAGHRGGFGSVPVEVTVGGTTWKTSLFPDAKSASFVLPVKQAVRHAEGLETDGSVSIWLRYDTERA